MGTWTIDAKTQPGVLRLKLAGRFTAEEMTGFLGEHNAAIDRLGRRDYAVWADLTDLAPLSPECAEIIEAAKRYSHARPNFRGSAVLVTTATIALQQHRTSRQAGVYDTELVSSDRAELEQHIERLLRGPAK